MTYSTSPVYSGIYMYISHLEQNGNLNFFMLTHLACVYTQFVNMTICLRKCRGYCNSESREF